MSKSPAQARKSNAVIGVRSARPSDPSMVGFVANITVLHGIIAAMKFRGRGPSTVDVQVSGVEQSTEIRVGILLSHSIGALICFVTDH